jgi:protein-tyrosine phosphatase
LAGRIGELPKKAAWRLIDAGWNCIVATDSHNLTTRPPHLSLGRDVLIRNRGDAFANELVRDKPAQIVGAVGPVLVT